MHSLPTSMLPLHSRPRTKEFHIIERSAGTRFAAFLIRLEYAGKLASKQFSSVFSNESLLDSYLYTRTNPHLLQPHPTVAQQSAARRRRW